QAGTAETDVARQEAHRQSALGEREQPAGTQPRGQPRQRLLLVAQVVQDVARPDEVGLAEVVEAVRQLRLPGDDPAAEAPAAGPRGHPVEQARPGVDGHHLGGREGLRQQTGHDAGPAADVEHPLDARGRQLGQPARRVAQVGGAQLGAALELGDLGVPVEVLGVSVTVRHRSRLSMSSSIRSMLTLAAAIAPCDAEVITWANGVATLPTAQTPGTLVAPAGSTATTSCSSTAQPSARSRPSLGRGRGATNTAVRGTTSPLTNSTAVNRSPSTRSRATLPSTTRTPRAASLARFSRDGSSVCANNTTSADHWLANSAWCTDIGWPASTPSGWSRTS